jgi:hypothetical protein
MKALMKKGAAAQVPGADPYALALAEVVGQKFFWCPVFPEDQKDVHVTSFTRQEKVGEGFAFWRGKELIIFVAPFIEFYEAASLREDWMNWQSDKHDWFDNFIAIEREALL